ncbi:hypothetical protein ACJX0J_020330, partial [Zea mays]
PPKFYKTHLKFFWFLIICYNIVAQEGCQAPFGMGVLIYLYFMFTTIWVTQVGPLWERRSDLYYRLVDIHTLNKNIPFV